MEKEIKNKFLLVTYIFILGLLLINYQWLGSLLGTVTNMLSPFITGAIIAFILNVIVNMLENGILKKMKKGKRALSLITSLIVVFGFVVILLFILIPQLKNAGMIFVENIPEYHENIYDMGRKFGLTNEQLSFLDIDTTKLINDFTSFISKNSSNLISFSFGFASSVIGAVTNFFVGLVFALYILIDKENLCRQFKKLFNRILSKKKYERTLEIISLSNKTFTNFIKVQFIEACILGFLCFIGMLIFNIPYAATISVLVGFTALIPIFGAFIGCALGAFLIFMISPVQALIFIAFFLVLQQIEGNFIYPKVVGGKIGLPSIWVLVGVMAGGSVGGVFGMLLGVPVLSVVYALIKEFVNTKKSLKETVKETIIDNL
jgi:predicted PurR-regulated permease PerM